MFIVTYEDGTQVIEHKDVPHWDAVSTEKKIVSVTVTDCGNLVETVSGYDLYLVCYDASLRMTQAGTFSANPEPKIVSQVVYAIRNHGPVKKLVQTLAHRIKSEMDAAFDPQVFSAPENRGNLFVLKARTLQHQELKDRVESILQTLDDTEVQVISLGFRKQKLSKKQQTQDLSKFKPGKSDIDLHKQEAEILARLKG